MIIIPAYLFYNRTAYNYYNQSISFFIVGLVCLCISASVYIACIRISFSDYINFITFSKPSVLFLGKIVFLSYVFIIQGCAIVVIVFLNKKITKIHNS